MPFPTARRAFRVHCRPLDLVCIVAATHRGAALSACLRDARDAGYRVAFTDFVGRRAREYDAWAAGDSGVRPRGEEHVRRDMAG